MTMANSTVASPMRSGASLRKTNKPLMEKRRRARINDSLSQLKSLVITGTKKDSSQFNKLEKADILELTVKHLRNLQNHQQQQQQQQQQHMAGNDSNGGPRYQDGFMECANEVIRYLGQAQGFSDDTKCRVINHLASCIQLANTKAKALHAGALATQPAAAPMNTTGAPTATVLGGSLMAPTAAVSAQGQIIQIVSGPPPAVAATATGKPQNVHILPSPPTATVLGNINMAAPHNNNNNLSSRPAGQQVTASPYNQPLHIHIPPAFSPVLVTKPENISATGVRHKQQQQQQPQPMDIAPRVVCPEQSPVRPVSSSMLPTSAFSHTPMSQKQTLVECSALTTTPDSTPSPQARLNLPSPVITPSPKQQQQQSQQTEIPITHVHKIHGFYSSAEDFVPSRPRTFSMTSSSSTSSSSSSSSENEVSSPLNLSSQSPIPCNVQSRKMSMAGESAPKPRHFMDKNNNISSNTNNNNNNNNSSDLYYNKNLSSYSNDQENVNSSGHSHSNSAYCNRSESYCPSQPFTSVVMNTRGKTSPDAADVTPALKYMSMMMEEDRQCTRNHGHRSRSASPASSVGEDRLWRPW